MLRPRWKLSEKSLEADRPVNDVQGISQKERPDSWELFETSRLQQQLSHLLKPIVNCGETSERGEFPGLIARKCLADPGLVAIGYGIEPQCVLALTNPVVFGRLLPEEVADGIEQLLNLATQIACREKCQWIRILLSASQGEPERFRCSVRKALSSSSFSCLAQIGEWHRIYSREECPLDSLRPAIAVRELLTVDQLCDVNLQSEVMRLLEDVLSTSSDLPKLPRPSASEKLAQWRSEGSQILLWRRDSHPVGICVIETSPSRNAVLRIALKYVGVAPQFRQQRIASRLIESVAAHSLEGNRSVGITVTADQSNLAAVRLYESLGFERQSEHEVWMKKIDI